MALTAATGVAASRLPAGKGVTFHSFLRGSDDVGRVDIVGLSTVSIILLAHLATITSFLRLLSRSQLEGIFHILKGLAKYKIDVDKRDGDWITAEGVKQVAKDIKLPKASAADVLQNIIVVDEVC